MKKKNNTYTKEILSILKTLAVLYPNQPISLHISIATSDYPSVDQISDKEFLFALEKYKMEKDLDYSQHTDDIEDIIKDGYNLDTFTNDEEEDY